MDKIPSLHTGKEQAETVKSRHDFLIGELERYHPRLARRLSLIEPPSSEKNRMLQKLGSHLSISKKAHLLAGRLNAGLKSGTLTYEDLRILYRRHGFVDNAIRLSRERAAELTRQRVTEHIKASGNKSTTFLPLRRYIKEKPRK